MKSIVIGAHLLRDDVEPLAEAVPVGDLFLSALPIPDEQSLGDRQLLLRIASIRAKLLEIATFIAIRYGFTITSTEDARSRCEPRLDRWKQLLVTHRTDVEIVLKTPAGDAHARPDRAQFTSGAAYLRALHEATTAARPDPDLQRAVENLLLPLAVRHAWLVRDSRSLELAMLIPRSRLEEIRLAGDALRRDLPDVPFLLSGPWPLEVFADDDQQ